MSVVVLRIRVYCQVQDLKDAPRGLYRKTHEYRQRFGRVKATLDYIS